ncbi:hypothetical protein NUW54_g14022 [Trametes sanguinea]|uniref:Uncharacterized protein n=1 Tax=Trametes sanguinea TaxID=158606 RepID=A0ACC1MFC9_9APHY|nr:hypothetical protein NUW54_g14022 [Trametes sanguinea]
MYACPSSGCSFSSTTKRGLSVHRTACKLRLPTISRAINKRKTAEEDWEELGGAYQHAQKRVRIEEPEIPAVQVAAAPSPPRSRSGRQMRVPSRLKDFIPLVQDELPAHLIEAFPDPLPQLSPSPQRYRSPTVEDEEEDEDVFETTPCTFGTFRRYTVPPQRDPEAHKDIEDICDISLPSAKPSNLPAPSNVRWLSHHAEKQALCALEACDSEPEESPPSLGPFDNASQFRLYDWHYNASLTKSKDDFNDLLDVLRSDGFSVDDLCGFSAQLGQEKLDNYNHPSGIFSADDGWLNATLEVPLPKSRHAFASEEIAPHYEVGAGT